MKQEIKIQVDAQVQWQVSQTDSGQWIAVCEPFALTMEEDSLDELWSSVKETLQLLFEDLLEDGELDEFLKSRGWRALPITPVTDGNVEFDVPFQLLVQSGNDSTRTVN